MAAIAAVLIGSWLTVDAEARERIFRRFSQRVGSAVVYSFLDETPAESRGIYTPGVDPGGLRP